MGGDNLTCNILCNPLYTVYCTTPKKDRLTVVGVLQGMGECSLRLFDLAFKLLETFNLPHKVLSPMQRLPHDTKMSLAQFLELLHTDLPQLGSQQQTRVLEAAAIAADHDSQTAWPVVQALVCDHAPQFKWLTAQLSLCWVHEGRHYKKLNPSVAYHRQLLATFLTPVLEFLPTTVGLQTMPDTSCGPGITRLIPSVLNHTHRLLGAGKTQAPSPLKRRLSCCWYWNIQNFLCTIIRTYSEHAFRVQRRQISYGTQTQMGTQAWDTFLSLVATTRKLGVSFIEYVRDRLKQACQIEPLAQMIQHRATVELLGLSWQPISQPTPDY